MSAIDTGNGMSLSLDFDSAEIVVEGATTAEGLSFCRLQVTGEETGTLSIALTEDEAMLLSIALASAVDARMRPFLLAMVEVMRREGVEVL